MNRFLYIVIVTILFSCSNDDSTTDTTQENDANYFPLVVNNTWEYNNIQEAEGMEPQQSRDALTVENTTTISGNTFFTFSQDELQEGFATGLFANGAVRKNGNELLYTGSLDFEFEGIEGFQIPITNAVVYNKTAVSGSQLFEIQNSVTQTIMEIPVTIDFTVNTIDAGDFESYTVGTQIFDNVIASQVIVNVAINANVLIVGQPTSIPILQAQDVVVATNYYAEDVGLIFSDVSIAYEAEDLSQFGFELPFPTSVSARSSQSIDIFTVTVD